MAITEDYEGYVEATEVATRFGVSMHTIRRRIREKEVFKGAIKVKLGGSERWLLPRDEVEQASMEQISPRLNQERYQNKLEPSDVLDGTPSSLCSNRELEERVAVLEQHVLKLLK